MRRRLASRLTLIAALVVAVGFAAYAFAGRARDAKVQVTSFSAGHASPGRSPGARRGRGWSVAGWSRRGAAFCVWGQRTTRRHAGRSSRQSRSGRHEHQGRRRGEAVVRGSLQPLLLADRREGAGDLLQDLGREDPGHALLAGRPEHRRRFRDVSGRQAGGGGRSDPGAAGPTTASWLAPRWMPPAKMRNTRDGDVARRWRAVIRNLPAKPGLLQGLRASARPIRAPRSRRPLLGEGPGPRRSRTREVPRRQAGGGRRHHRVRAARTSSACAPAAHSTPPGRRRTPGTATWPSSG